MILSAWFSASALFSVEVEGLGPVNEQRCIFVFRARHTGNFTEAFEKSLKIGRSMQSSYPNADGHQVHVKLIKVETIDWLGRKITDGREVWYESLEARDPLADSGVEAYEPEKSFPGQTGI